MAETVQVNVRVPKAARDLLSRIAARLRRNPEFATQLDGYIRSLDDPSVDASLADRVARLEARLDALDGGTPRNVSADTPMTVGEGRGRRLTPAGEAELRRRIGAGDHDADIAQAIGVSINTVRNRR